MFLTRLMILTMAALSGLATASQADDAPFKQENTPENLKQLCIQLQTALARKDATTADALGLGLMPDESRLKKGLKDDIAEADLKAILEMRAKFKQIASGGADKLFSIKPDQTQVKVHASTTEELGKYAKGSPAYEHFPGGCQALAMKALRPGLTFYEVEFVKPGERAGMKFHLFYWDGGQWSMLGPVWRVVK